ncbi:Protein of unknown function DUF2078, membrane [Sulfobacillus thermosulfidooxidans DSM 9293]|uniref:SHOCT domain-containing protein n=1 Tax=Sulfobacillus thermosulfidooxidans (strain DSM 9293 / VKM B-1269 / AT-1) TaxID=929705 RepID=A0A1W1WGJ4_SULTA|nr:SHOCT domain-containing protein [Sulfobacillus thermosulfidooxidans]SMC05365.1 Protein of unknown function DUF2078, membrane [Sulfobacillus thermosulfidooxidans DSM 9293]
MPMMFGFGLWWMFPLSLMVMMAFVGGVVLPRAFRGHLHVSSNTPSPDPLAVARERYAQGLIAKPEFDQIVQDLVSTEDALGMIDGQASTDRRRMALRHVERPPDQDCWPGARRYPCR